MLEAGSGGRLCSGGLRAVVGAGRRAGDCGGLVLALAQAEGWGCQRSPSVVPFCGLHHDKERLPRGGPAPAVCLALGCPPVRVAERGPAEVRREGVSWR